MDVLESPDALSAWSSAVRGGGKRLGFAPTMGALHRGHLSLVGRSAEENDATLVSIFVNPLQFDDPGDLAAYPETLEADLAALRGTGVDAVYLGRAVELYPPGFQSYVEPRGTALPLEGAGRPGHFRGVATIVLKLLLLCRPHRAYFGLKDYQQLRVVEALACDLHLDCRIVPCPIVREADGLAMSSRNARLAPQERQRALALVGALRAACAAWSDGERDRERLEEILLRELARHPGVEPEYAVVVDPGTLEPWGGGGTPRALIAARLGAIRLIDNAALDQRPLVQEAEA